jgi:hypothetical protein
MTLPRFDPDNDMSAESFLRRNAVALMAFCFTLVMGMIGYHNYQSDQKVILELVRSELRRTAEAVGRIEASGSGYAQQTRWIVDQHTRDITNLREENRETAKLVSEMRSDLRLVAEWVKDQRAKTAGLTNTFKQIY